MQQNLKNSNESSLLKFLSLQKKFYSLSVDVEISVKQTERKLNKLIPKARVDSELAEFLISVKEQGENVLKLLHETRNFLQEIVNDAEVVENAKKRDLIKDYQMYIELLQSEINKFHDSQRIKKSA